MYPPYFQINYAKIFLPTYLIHPFYSLHLQKMNKNLIFEGKEKCHGIKRKDGETLGTKNKVF